MRCASARRTIPRPAIWCPAWSPASAATAIASACRRSAASRISTPPITATSWSTRCASASPAGQDLLFGAAGPRKSGGLCRRQDRARRHPWRDHGLGRVRRGFRGEAPDRAGRRSLHREAAARSLPRTDGDRRHRRHPGHGRGRPDLVLGRDGRQGRARHRARSRQGAGARDRHDRLRDHAVRKPGAHADGAQARAARPGPGHLREMGARFRRDRPAHRHRPAGAQDGRQDRGRHAGRAAGRAGAGL